MNEEIQNRLPVTDTAAEIENSPRFVQKIIDTSSSLIYIYDLQERCNVYTNSSVTPILGHRPEELMALGSELPALLVHPEDATKVAEHHGRMTLAREGEIHEIEYRMKHAAGHWVLLRSRDAVFSRSADDRPKWILGVAEDITERRRLEAQSLQAQKLEAIGRLAGGVAHDFNNLLTGICGYADLLLYGIPAANPNYANIVEIKQAATRAAGLVAQLLAFSRHQGVEPKIVNLNERLAESHKLLRRVIGEHIQLNISSGEALWPVWIDPSRLEQVIFNLVLNARDAMPAGGRITIETSNVPADSALPGQGADGEPRDHVLLCVRDAGTGMSRDAIAHLFEPFYTTKEAGKGIGLGLSAVYGIVQQAGGFIDVASQSGEGSIFKVYLPRVAETDLARDSAVKAEAPALGGVETVLLVEDEEMVRGLISQFLHRQGYHVVAAANGDEAIQWVEAHPDQNFQLLLTDIVLPGMTGYEVARHLRRLDPGLRVLFTSGYAGEDIINHPDLASGGAFLQKPFALAALARKVRELLDQ